jgi:hypothetical protein
MGNVRRYVILCLGIALTISLVLQPSFIVFGTESPLGESNMNPPITPTTPPPSSTQGATKMPTLALVKESTDSQGITFLTTEDKPTVQTVEKKEISQEMKDLIRGYMLGIRLAFGIAQGIAENVTADQKFPAAKIIAQMPATVERFAMGEYTDAYRAGVFLGLREGAEIVELFGVAGVAGKRSPATIRGDLPVPLP